MKDSAKEEFFIPRQQVLGTHPEFNSHTKDLSMCSFFGLYNNATVTDIAEMLLEVGTLILMKEYPNKEDLSLEDLNNKLPSEYKSLANVQKPNVKMVDPVSFYLQKFRYYGEYKTNSEVTTSLNAIMYIAGEYIKDFATNKKTLRSVQRLFIDNMLVAPTDQEKSSEPQEQT